MTFNKVNNLAGWMVCAIACTVYLLTMEPTVSLWDCGEFISTAYTMGIPHPPGAPLFILIARFFIILFGNNPHTAAIAVNSMSAIASGFTILFLFWTITHFARKLVQKNDAPLSRQAIFSIISAGVVGALAYTFSDSFWFSAVEGEVYALSSFFTALVFWAILKWEQQSHKAGADKWLVFIFFMMGLSIGVHLLNLLTIPAIIMMYYYKRFKVTRRNTILAFLIGCSITGFVMKFIIVYTVKGAGAFDVYFTNELGMPFFSGFTVFFLLIAATIAWGIRIANKRKLKYLTIGLWSCAFMLLGYSTYLTTMIRSNANPGVDMYNIDNPISLEGYLSREKYGDWPIVYGPDFTEKTPYAKTGDEYVRGKNKYEVAGSRYIQNWSAAPGAHLFPRMYDASNDRGQVDCYRQFAGLEIGETPTIADNIRYFTRYQAGWMYMRYFMWNFVGRQNDLQGFGNPRDSNFISGISFIDNVMVGNQQKMPDTAHVTNKAFNRLYMLPLLLGVAGLVYQFKRSRRDGLVNGLLFFFTGLAIVLFLNQAGYQPRERDYAFVGSFYAFSIWIGLGVLWVKQMLEKVTRPPIAAYLAAGLCLLAVPVLMAQQEWDDHDRSQKTLALDLAKNYLKSCPPNAILFTAEDNDSYALWYAQEVEGIRKDVRVVVSTLIGTDWGIDQLRYKVNNSAPFNVVFRPDQVAGDKLNVIYYSQTPGYDKDKYYDLYNILKNVVGSDDQRFTTTSEDGDTYSLYPTQKFSVPVDVKTVMANGTIHAGDKVVDSLHIDLSSKNYLFKNDLAILAVIAGNQWKRPICFSNLGTAQDMGLDKYTRLNGLTYQLVPVENTNTSGVNLDVAYNNVMQYFGYGNAGKKGVYFDEENRRRLNTIKLAHAQIARSLAQAGRKEEARKILHRYDEHVNEANVPYGMTTNRGNIHNIFSLQFLEACYLADDLPLANKVAKSLKKDLQQQMQYYHSLGDGSYTDEQMINNAWLLTQGKAGDLSNRQASFAQDILSSYQLLQQIEKWEQEFQPKRLSVIN
ncbi:MAG: protein O-mannosyl-transferase family [Niastella sp.]|uniref:protein O-mannosyl-transferase family n=1 Tax=Niastella sp. TaxID=1869183 RepID=UPI0038998F88